MNDLLKKHTLRLTLFVITVFMQFVTISQVFAQYHGGDATLKVGEYATVSIPVSYPARATNISYNWTCNNSAVASISNKTIISCTVYGEGQGTCTVNYQGSFRLDGYYRSYNYYFNITVKPNGPTRIEVSPHTLTLDEDVAATLYATTYGGESPLSWSSSNNNVVTVWGNGTSADILTVREGTAYVYARANNGCADYCVVTVKKKVITPTSITLPDTATVCEGDSIKISTIVIPANASYTLTWSSSDTNIATVSPNGQVYGHNIGTVRITALVDGYGLSDYCDITVIAKAVKPKEAYAVFNDSTLTFYYDDKMDNRNGEVYDEEGFRPYYWGWRDIRNMIKTVVFDTSFANYDQLTTIYGWFQNCNYLEEIVGMENLVTTNIINMACLFSGCKRLEYVDVSHFDTKNVRTMQYMFSETGLKTLDLTSFDTQNVTSMLGMFYASGQLTSIDITSFDTSKVINMSAMFRKCYYLTEVDVSRFDTRNVIDMAGMFSCTHLSHIDVSRFDTRKVTRMNEMFRECRVLEDIDLSSFNTDRVTSMAQMFQLCQSLRSLDLSTFNTEEVESMLFMFDRCTSLQYIYVGDGWNISNVILNTTGEGESLNAGYNMFWKCSALVGGAGTTYNNEYTDYTYAHVDEGPSNPGYLTYKTTTSTKKVTTSDSDYGETVYTLDGLRVDSHRKKGIYIKDGKKQIVK